MKILLIVVAVFSIICSPNIYAYDTNHSLHGVRTSFLFGKIRGGPELKFNTSLMYLSSTWSNTERLSFIQRIKNNGDTHIDVYARASGGHLPGGVVDPNENLRTKLIQLNNNGLKPVLWMTPESKHKDRFKSQAEHEAFMNKTIIQNDDQVAAYVVCLECDEYWSAEQVNHYVNYIKARTDKPVAVHLAPGVGGYKKDINYYKNADYIFLQIGNHLTGDYVADVELAKRMLNEALQLGIPVVANEYALHSESAQAKALGDLMCSMGAVGTGNGRNITFCGAEESHKKSNFLKKHETELIGIAGVSVAIAAVYFYNKQFGEMPIDFSLRGNEDYQIYGLGRTFNLTDNSQIMLNYERLDREGEDTNVAMISYNISF
jgi:hypothetical protein